MIKFDYNQYCIEMLFECVPEIKNIDDPELREDFEWYAKGSPLLSHCVYQDVLCKYFLMLIKKKDKKSKEIVNHIVNLIEKLASHGDFQVRCVADVSFCEPLLDQLKPKKDIEKYLLPKSLELARDVGKRMFDLDPLTWEEKKK